MKSYITTSKLLESKIITEKREDQKTISFSQFSVYKQCPHRWYLTYVKKLYPFTSSIDTVFGTAIHISVQKYLHILLTETVKASEEFDIEEFFEQAFKDTYKKELESNNGKHFTTPELMGEYYEDGLEILKYLKKKRNILYPHTDLELIGIEIPIMQAVGGTENILFQGYIDIITRDKHDGTIYIDDFKTSKSGWDSKVKSDEVKLSQILYYKKYFSEQYGVPVDKIVPRFVILKRKIYEDASFPIPRIVMFEPAHGTGKLRAADIAIGKFIHECFTFDGEYVEKEYQKCPGNSCRFCPFDGDRSLCNKKNIV